jgi:DNA-binding transcriptional ArsR family regulator
MAGEAEQSTRNRVAELLRQGMSRGQVARELGLAKSTVSYHAKRLGWPPDTRAARRYDWAAVQAYYDEGHSVRSCQQRFGFSRQSWHAAVTRGAIVPRPHGMPLEELLVATPRSRNNVKLRLIRAGLKAAECEDCGTSEWLGRPLSLALHHVNGDRHDNRLGNLRLLCPNCHSQTDTFGSRNKRRLVVVGDA